MVVLKSCVRVSLLRDDADVRVQRGERELRVVDAAEGEPPFGRVVVPEEQVDHRALAAAALADESAHRALFDGEAHAAQHLGGLRVWVRGLGFEG